MHSAVKKALMLAHNRRQYQTGGVPDDASQEAFLHEQLQGSAPQYDPQGGLETAKTAAQSLAGMTTPGAIADAAGYLGGPSALQNLRDQNYFDAALQLAAVVPGVGPLSKAAKLSKEAEEAANIKRYIERTSPDLSVARRYKTTEKAKETLKPGQRLVHTMIEDPPVIPPPIKRDKGGPIDDHLTGRVELGQPDEASQEAFLQEQLQGSAPQYTPEEGMLTGKRAGLMAAGFAPGAGIATAAGQFPTAEGGKEPSMAEDWRKGEYFSAGLKGLGAAGDIAYGVPLVGPAVGAAMKAPLVAKLAMAAAPMAKVVGEVAPATEAVSRVTNPIGMYSAAAEAARALPQEKGTLQQMLATMKGVTPEELHWSGVHEAFAGKPTVTREELAKHFEERLPGVSETVLGGYKSEYPYRTADEWQAAINRAERQRNWDEVDRLTNAWEHFEGYGASGASGSAKFQKHTIPGGENYREVLLHTPPSIEGAAGLTVDQIAKRLGYSGWHDSLTPAQKEAVNAAWESQAYGPGKGPAIEPTRASYKSQHWDQPNVLSHLRMSDRTGPEGEKILHLEELQSDWGQKGRKEGFEQQHPEFFVKNKRSGFSSEAFKTREEAETYQNRLPESLRPSTVIIEQTKKTEGLPPAPYVASPEGKHTLSWVDLGLKRALKEAAEGGYDKLIWTPGEEQAARYDLSKQVRSIDWNEYETDRYPGVNKIVQIEPIEGNTIELPVDSKGRVAENVGTQFDGKPLDEVVGKDLANKILNDRYGSLSGSGLQIGGEGMKKFYDKIVPNQLQKIVKKLDKDAKVQLGGYPITAERGKPTQYADFDEWNNAPEFSQINAHVIQITPKMREAILKGFSAYAAGGAVKPRNSSHLDPIIKRGMDAVRRVKSQDGGLRTIIRRRDNEPVRGIRFHYPNEVSSDQPDIQDYQMKRHAHEFIGSPEPEVPQRGVYVDAPLFGGRNKLFSMSYYYQPLVEKALNLIYGQKTTPFYYIPETNPIARAVDAYETAKFVQRDPSNWKNYLGVPGTLMGLNKFGAPAVVAGAVAARDPEKIEQKEPEKLGPFDYGTTPEIISHQKGEPEIMQQAKPLEYAKGGEIHDDFESLMAEVDELLEKFKD